MLSPFESIWGITGGAILAYYSPTTDTAPQWFADYKNNKFYSKGFVTEPNAMTTELSTPVTVRDSDGNLKWSAHNLALNSATPATQSITVVSGADYTVEMTGTGSFALTGAGTGTATDGSSVEITASTTSLTITLTGSATLVWVYRSDLGGTQPNPSTGTSYVPTTTAAVYARPVQYDTSGDRVGMPIPPQRTNQITVSDDLTDASWTKTNITPVKTETGVGGEANGASKLTATAANGTCTFAITSASAVKIASAFVKRITGTGTVEMTLDGGTTWEAVTLTTSFVQAGTASQTITNPTVGFRIVTSGDEIAVQIAQCEGGAFITPGIPTNGSTVTRNAVEVKAPKAYVGTDAELTEGTWVLGVRDISAGAGSNNRLIAATSFEAPLLVDSSNARSVKNYNGTITTQKDTGASLADGASHKLAISFEDGVGLSLTGDGATPATASADYLTTNPPTEFHFMQKSDQTFMPGGILEWAVYFPDRLSDAEIATITDATTSYPA